jgi:excisionase family DNA binding protein
MGDKELTAHEAAAQLGYHVNHVYRLLAAGTLKGRQFNRVWIIKQSEVDRVKALQDSHGRLHN